MGAAQGNQQRAERERRTLNLRHLLAPRQRKRFGQEEGNRRQVEGRHARRHKRRDAVTGLAEQTAEGRADDESQPEGRADETKTFGAVLLVGHI
jgi:hypothetical protein